MIYFDEDAKRAAGESNLLRHKLRQLVWHDTLVLTAPLKFNERTYPVGAQLQIERVFDTFDPIMTLVDEQGRIATIDGWELAEHGEYTKIDAPDNEPF